MDFPDDGFEPAGSAPVAVIRRRGESREQVDYRKQGYSDEQTGYGSRRESPLARSHRLALAREREARMQQADAQGQVNFEREQTLKEKQFAAQQEIQGRSLRDKDAATEQARGFLAEEGALADKFGIYSRQHIEGVLAMARKYPAAVLGDERVGKQLSHYQDFYVKNIGGNPDLPTALWEVGQFDPESLPPAQAAQYLGEIAGKYPTVANDKAFADLLALKTKNVASRAAIEQARIDGLQPTRVTADTPGGNVTLEDPKAAKDTELAALERERKLYTTESARARTLRQLAEGKGDDLVAAADAAVKDYSAKLEEVESQIRSHRGGGAKEPSQPDTAPATSGSDPQKTAAVKWLEANPDDPRAEAIRKKLGL